MKYCHHGTRNRHDMSTHLRKVRTDPNLPICATSVCAVYVPLPWSNCRLYIPIGTRTELHSSVSGLSTQASTPTECLDWQAITNCRRYNYAPGKAHGNVPIGQINIFRSSWRISKSYSRCCSSSSSCGLFCFTAYSFHRNFLKLGIYM